MAKSLADKFLNGLKKGLIIGASALIPYISHGQEKGQELYQVPHFAKLQTKAGEIELGGPKFYNVKYISKPIKKDALGFELYPFIEDVISWTTDGKKLTSFESKVVYVGREMDKSQILLKSTEESPLGVDGNKGEAVEKGDLVGGNFTYDLGEMSKNLRAAVFPNDTLYYCYLDHENDSSVLSGEKAQFVFLRKVKDVPLLTSDSKGNIYLNGRIYEIIADKSRSDLETLTDSTESGVVNLVYDSTYLKSNEAQIKEIVKKEGTPGHVKDFFGEPLGREKTKEKKSCGEGRLMFDVQAGKTLGLDDNKMAVNNGRASLQYKLSEGTAFGLFAGASNSTYHSRQTVENPEQDSLINSTANLHRIIRSKTDISDEMTAEYELGALASCMNKSGSLRFDLGMSVLGEKRKRTVQTSGDLKILQGDEELNSSSFSSQPVSYTEYKTALEGGVRVSAGVYVYPAKLLKSKSKLLGGFNLGVSGQYTASGFDNGNDYYKYPSAAANVGFTYSFGGSKKSGETKKSEEGK